MKNEIKLNLGCGVGLLNGFINIDNSFSLNDVRSRKGVFRGAQIGRKSKFIQADMRKLPIQDNTVDYIECLEAIEHIPYGDVPKAIREWHRVLKKGGKLVIFTTDFDDIAQMWVDFIKGKGLNMKNWFTMSGLIYGNQVTEGEYHRSFFNIPFFNAIMQLCGFKKFQMVGYPRGAFPPKFRGAKWPKKAMGCAMILIEATK